MASDIEETSVQSSIKQIDRRSVHQICSGQVILNLATAVKELIENSVDAGATNVEIKLKEYGVDSFEVSDNGSGIEEKDFKAIALKHCTSKLRDFEDLGSVATFGFRGEALSSLCALSKLTIITRHSLKNFGSKLEFDYNGNLTSIAPCAREPGTTVIINQLFHTLPVRHKEFQRNIKKEFPKLNAILQAYGIINTGVRISCLNVTEKNKKVVLLSTPGAESIIENIASIFGPKQVKSLMKFEQSCPSEEILESFSISPKKLPDNKDVFAIDGYVSFTDHNCGRSSLDRQFFFINKRPCDIAKISRLVNEVYHIFNRHQNPFIFLDIGLKADMVDVNITPDKRQIFIQNEKLLLAILKSSLLKMFSESAGNYQVQVTQHVKSPALSFADGHHSAQDSKYSNSPKKSDSNISSSFLGGDQAGGSPIVDKKENNFNDTVIKMTHVSSNDPNVSSNDPNVSSILSKFRSKFSKSNTLIGAQTRNNEQLNMDKFLLKIPKESHFPRGGGKRDSSSTDEIALTGSKKQDLDCDGGPKSDSKEERGELTAQLDEKQDVIRVQYIAEGTISAKKDRDCRQSAIVDITPEKCVGNTICKDSEAIESSAVNPVIELEIGDLIEDHGINTLASPSSIPVEDHCDVMIKERELDTHGNQDVSSSDYDCNKPAKRSRLVRHTVDVPCDLDKIMKHWCPDGQDDGPSANSQLLGFRAKITPQQNNAAEEELRKYISKDAFRKMEIIGQFNLGFIIAKAQDDVFIIDQHASDEKYNFETLQNKHCLKSQRLIQPRPLELTPVNESILLDNIEIFRKNGFEFNVDLDQLASHKISLVSLPTSKNWTFDIQDIEELIFMLSDNPGVMCRPSRVRSMFASRACRMSTMVGNALNSSQMKTLVNHMAEIEHPWNCPHGRPTMRHLVNLKRIGDAPERCLED